jgi:ribosomal protein S18 acetylase RimI-like enzyme
MRLDFVSITHFGLDQAADVLTRAFSDYLVKIVATPAILQQMARVDSVDFALSRIVLCDGAPAGAALIATRSRATRLAGMALLPEARRRGIGRSLVMRVIEESRVRGDRSIVLEVIEQNAAAVRLYESCGFSRVRRLVGFRRPIQAEDVALRPVPQLKQVDLQAVAAVVKTNGLADLPWQLSAETLAQLPASTVGYTLDGAWVAVTTPEGVEAGVRALVTEQLQHGNGRGAALLRAVLVKHPGKEWRMSPIWPNELAAVFLEAGFARTPISQWQMAREFACVANQS